MSDKRYANHKNYGRVEILAGPERDQKYGHSAYWVRDSEGELVELDAVGLTFPPHAEYWQRMYTDGPSGMLYMTKRDALDNKIGLTHLTHHYQQNEGDEWQVERIELDA